MQTPPRGAITVLLATIVVNMLGVGLAWPILPKLIQQIEGGDVSSAAATYAWLAAIFAVAQFLFSPVMGALSDSFGRRPVILVALAGLAIDYAIMTVAPSLFWVAVARLVAGMFGAVVSTANACMADMSTPENRARHFGYLGAAFGVGFIAGPVIGGVLGEYDLRLPFLAAGVLAALNFTLAWFILPETHVRKNRAPFRTSEANPLKAFSRLTRYPVIAPLLVALFVTAVAQRGLESVWVLYADYRFGWSVRDAAFSLAFVGFMFVVVQGVLVGPVVNRFGEARVMAGGFAVSTAALACYMFADRGWMAYPLIAFHVLGNALANPALTALCSRAVGVSEQGRLQGTLNAVNALAVIAGPFLASLLLAATTRPGVAPVWSGAWFGLCAVAFGVCAGLAVRRLRRDAPAQVRL